jgi:hypothetical protein
VALCPFEEMKMRFLLAVMATTIFGATLAPKAAAEAPFEEYHVSRSSISAPILRNAIGVLTITSGVKRGKQLRAYRKNHQAWLFDHTIHAIDTKPVSNFGYHSQPVAEETGSERLALDVIQGGNSNSHAVPADDDISSYRFPILKKSGQFLEIAIDSVKDSRVWVSTGDLAQGFLFEENYFSDLTHLKEFLVDPFFGTRGITRRIYKKPDLSAEASELSRGLFKVLGERNGFIQLGQDVGTEDEEKIEPVGWIPIRDADGLLTIWIALEDNG